MEKIIKTARRLDKVLSIIRVALIVISVLSIVASVVVVAAANRIVDAINQSDWALTLSGDALKLSLNPSMLMASDLRAMLLTVILVLAVLIVITLYTVHLLKCIFGDMREGRPFSQSVPSRIRRIAYMIFTYSLVVPTISFIPNYFLYRLANVQQILAASPMIEQAELSLHFSVDFLALFIGFVVILFSFVFEYGAKLQLEADETL